MKITKALIIVELDNSEEPRQLFIKDHHMRALIAMIESGMFHDKEVLISENVIETIAFKKDKQ